MRESVTRTIEANWDELESMMDLEISEFEKLGWELHQIAGPTFSNGSHVILVFQRDSSAETDESDRSDSVP